jgi:dTDP-4-amino-4,6-dideoxygalactose transaminase
VKISEKSTQEPFLPYAAAWFGPEEKQELLAALDSGWITTGPRTRQFERAFATYIGTSESIAVSSCTAALHLSLLALGVGPGDAVITTPFTFAATANVIVHCGALPVFVDVDPDTYNLDPVALKRFLEANCTWRPTDRCLYLNSSGHRIRAIIAVHYGGVPVEMAAIGELATRFELPVVEDAAHAAGSNYRGRNAGTLGRVACFSFYATKNMTTAEGGMVTTNDAELAERVRVLSLHGISKDAWKRYSVDGSWRYDVTEAGFKYNMTDLASALGLRQLEKLDGFIARRGKLAELYNQALSRVKGLKLPTVPTHVESAWHLYPVQIDSEYVTRDEVVEQLRLRNIGTSVHFIPLHLMSFYRQTFGYKPGDFPVAEHVFKRIVSLPLFPRMQDSDVARVAHELALIVEPSQLAIAR